MAIQARAAARLAVRMWYLFMRRRSPSSRTRKLVMFFRPRDLDKDIIEGGFLAVNSDDLSAADKTHELLAGAQGIQVEGFLFRIPTGLVLYFYLSLAVLDFQIFGGVDFLETSVRHEGYPVAELIHIVHEVGGQEHRYPF